VLRKQDYLYLYQSLNATHLRKRKATMVYEYSLIVVVTMLITAWFLYDFNKDDDDWDGTL
jgi:hypothetical protein